MGAGHGDPQALVPGDRHLGTDLDDGLELHRSRLAARRDLDLGRGDGVDVLFLERLDVEVGERVPQRLFSRNIRAEAGLEDAAWSFAGPEARDPRLAGDLAEGGVDRLVELALLELDGHLDLVALEGLDGGPHRAATLPGGPANPSVTYSSYAAFNRMATRWRLMPSSLPIFSMHRPVRYSTPA